MPASLTGCWAGSDSEPAAASSGSSPVRMVLRTRAATRTPSRTVAALLVRFAGRAPAGRVARDFQSGMGTASRLAARVGALPGKRRDGVPDETGERLVRGV